MTNEQLCALAKQGDVDAQNLLIENNLPFVRMTAYEIWNSQSELNASLQIDPDDLIQEGSLGLLGCIENYNPDGGNLFLTYAAPAVRNAMIDYIRSQNVSFEVKNLNSIISLDELAKDEEKSKHNFIADPTRQTPEQIYLAQERYDDLHHALEMIEAREAKGLSQRALAKLSGVKQPAIARMESMKSTPQINTLIKVLIPLGYTLEIVPLNQSAR